MHTFLLHRDGIKYGCKNNKPGDGIGDHSPGFYLDGRPWRRCFMVTLNSGEIVPRHVLARSCFDHFNRRTNSVPAAGAPKGLLPTRERSQSSTSVPSRRDEHTRADWMSFLRNSTRTKTQELSEVVKSFGYHITDQRCGGIALQLQVQAFNFKG